MSKKRASSVRPPLLTGDNYSSWKEVDVDLDEDMTLLLKRFKKFVKFKKKDFGSKGNDLKMKAKLKDDEPKQTKGIQCYKCGGFGHISPECSNLKDRRKGKAMATSLSEDKSEEDPSSEEELATNYVAFGATHVEVEDDGKVALTSDPIEEINEEVAIEVVGVATH